MSYENLTPQPLKPWEQYSLRLTPWWAQNWKADSITPRHVWEVRIATNVLARGYSAGQALAVIAEWWLVHGLEPNVKGFTTRILPYAASKAKPYIDEFRETQAAERESREYHRLNARILRAFSLTEDEQASPSGLCKILSEDGLGEVKLGRVQKALQRMAAAGDVVKTSYRRYAPSYRNEGNASTSLGRPAANPTPTLAADADQEQPINTGYGKKNTADSTAQRPANESKTLNSVCLKTTMSEMSTSRRSKVPELISWFASLNGQIVTPTHMAAIRSELKAQMPTVTKTQVQTRCITDIEDAAGVTAATSLKDAINNWYSDRRVGIKKTSITLMTSVKILKTICDAAGYLPHRDLMRLALQRATCICKLSQLTYFLVNQFEKRVA